MHERDERREWWCRFTLRVLAAAFAVGTLVFAVQPDRTVRSLNATGAWLGDFPPAPASALRLWLTLATGYMVLVAALAYVAQRDLRRHRDLVGLLALGKATTSLAGLGFYLYSLPAFAYLLTFVVDGGIAIAALAIWRVAPSLGAVPETSAVPVGSVRGGSSPAIVHAVLEAMVPPGGPFAEGADEIPVAAGVEAFVAAAGPSAPRVFRFCMGLFEWSPLFLPPLRLRRFSRLSVAQRVRVLEAWERSRLMPRRQAVHLLKLLVMSQFYSHPAVEARLGYPYPLDRVPREEAGT